MFYYKMVDGVKQYTFKEDNAISVLPAKFSPEDGFSNERYVIKKRNRIYPFDD